MRHAQRGRAGLHLGIVGFGRLARGYYAPALARIAGIGSISVTDPLAASRQAALRLLPAATVVDDTDALFDAEPDAILVASPPSTHLAVWNRACDAGIRVFMEKPFVLAGELEYAERSERARRLLMPDFNRRFWPLYMRMREVAAAGAIGELRSVAFDIEVDVRPWLSVTRHRLSPDEGGLLHDLGSQALDFLCVAHGGNVVWLEAESDLHSQTRQSLNLSLEFSDGVTGRARVAYGERTQERAAMTGSDGRIFSCDPNMSLHVERRTEGDRFPMRMRDVALLGYRGLRRSRSMLRYSVHAALQKFVQGCSQRVAFEPGFEEAFRNALLIEYVAASLGNGRCVEVDGG